MAESQLSLPGVIPTEVPQQAIEPLRNVLKAVENHFDTTKAKLTDDHMGPLLGYKKRQWQRIKQELRGKDDKKRLGGYDWLEGWPPGKGWHPWWEPLVNKPHSVAQSMESSRGYVFRITTSAFDESNNLVVLEFEETYDENYVFVARRLIKPEARNGKLLGHLSALAAGVSTIGLLDLSDGRLDGVLHWCYVLLEHIPPAIRG
jgi:hypothetical protein